MWHWKKPRKHLPAGNVLYRAARAWDFSLGYLYSTRKIATDTYYNLMRYSVPTLSVTRYW